MRPVLLSIAGSDSGGGAGIQADLKTFAAHQTFGTTAITAITAQDTRRVYRVDPVPLVGVRRQVRAVLDDLPVAAVKIGMLGTAEIADAVREELAHFAGPVVLDPVMVATSGDRLLDAAAESALLRLAERATVITPNLPEAAVFAGSEREDALLDWAERCGFPVLLTGGDAETDDVIDRLFHGEQQTTWTATRVAGGPFHGTGCTLSSALACRLATGEPLVAACEGALRWVQKQLTRSAALGSGSRVLLHTM